jgi:hypothetical protein
LALQPQVGQLSHTFTLVCFLDQALCLNSKYVYNTQYQPSVV